MSRQKAVSNARRIVSATARVEAQAYDFATSVRKPRLTSATGILWCVPSGTIAGGTLPPSGAPGGPLTGQTIYAEAGGVYTALSGTFDVYCNYPAGVASGKLLAVIPNADGSYRALAQSCS